MTGDTRLIGGVDLADIAVAQAAVGDLDDHLPDPGVGDVDVVDDGERLAALLQKRSRIVLPPQPVVTAGSGREDGAVDAGPLVGGDEGEQGGDLLGRPIPRIPRVAAHEVPVAVSGIR